MSDTLEEIQPLESVWGNYTPQNISFPSDSIEIKDPQYAGSIRLVLSNELRIKPDLNFNDDERYYFIYSKHPRINQNSNERDMIWHTIKDLLKLLKVKYQPGSVNEDPVKYQNVLNAEKFLGSATGSWIARKFHIDEYLSQIREGHRKLQINKSTIFRRVHASMFFLNTHYICDPEDKFHPKAIIYYVTDLDASLITRKFTDKHQEIIDKFKQANNLELTDSEIEWEYLMNHPNPDKSVLDALRIKRIYNKIVMSRYPIYEDLNENAIKIPTLFKVFLESLNGYDFILVFKNESDRDKVSEIIKEFRDRTGFNVLLYGNQRLLESVDETIEYMRIVNEDSGDEFTFTKSELHKTHSVISGITLYKAKKEVAQFFKDNSARIHKHKHQIIRRDGKPKDITVYSVDAI